jgi:hypothetical protein
MLLSYLRNRLHSFSGRRPAARPTARRPRPCLEALDERTLPAVTGLHVGPSAAANHSFLNASAIVAANDAWAVGEFTDPRTGLFQPLTEHFDGTRWTAVPTPALASGNFGELMGVSAVSSNDVWAVGVNGNVPPWSPLIEHWDGVKWSVVAGPPGATGTLNAVTAISAHDVWAVGLNNLIEHFNGSSWSVVPGPSTFGQANLYGVSGTSSNDVWAVGSIGRHPNAEVLHWDGTAWSAVSAPSPAFDSSLRSVVALAPDNVWAVGVTNVGPTRTLIEHFDGKTWSVVASPNPGGTGTNANVSLRGVAAVSANDVWAVGTFTDPNTGFGRTLTEHWDGTSWSVVPSPNATTGGQNALNGVAASSGGAVVAVGFAIDANGNTNNLILQK